MYPPKTRPTDDFPRTMVGPRLSQFLWKSLGVPPSLVALCISFILEYYAPICFLTNSFCLSFKRSSDSFMLKGVSLLAIIYYFLSSSLPNFHALISSSFLSFSSFLLISSSSFLSFSSLLYIISSNSSYSFSSSLLIISSNSYYSFSSYISSLSLSSILAFSASSSCFLRIGAILIYSNRCWLMKLWYYWDGSISWSDFLESICYCICCDSFTRLVELSKMWFSILRFLMIFYLSLV